MKLLRLSEWVAALRFYGDYLVAPVEMMSPFNSSVSSKKVYAGKFVMRISAWKSEFEKA